MRRFTETTLPGGSRHLRLEIEFRDITRPDKSSSSRRARHPLASSQPTIHTATKPQTHRNDDFNGMRTSSIFLAPPALKKGTKVRFGIAKVVWYNDEEEEEEGKRREPWTKHTSHPERDCISTFLLSFSFRRWGFSLPFVIALGLILAAVSLFCLGTTFSF
jgi:hypothetical protein